MDSDQDEVAALVEFAAGHAPSIMLGEKTELSFRGGGLVSNLETEALTVLRTDEQTRRCYSFRLGQMPKGLLLVLANRRNAIRVRPQDSKPVRIRLLDLSGKVYAQAVVHDISARGLSIVVDPALEAELFNIMQVRLSVLLPAATEAIDVVATIRNRRLCGSAILYGLGFDEQSPGFQRAHEQLSSYLSTLHSSGRPRA